MDNQRDKARLATVAEQQRGRVAWRQIQPLGIDRKTVHRWVVEGYLYRVLPTVYAVGHQAPSIEGDLAAALLYAGPGAALSHATAAWWLGLIDERPRTIHVTTPRKCRSLPSIKVYGRRRGDRIIHNRLPATTLPQIFLDLAATAPLRTVRKALANADYKGIL